MAVVMVVVVTIVMVVVVTMVMVVVVTIVMVMVFGSLTTLETRLGAAVRPMMTIVAGALVK